ncbi:MAG: N-6 DNA methylase [Rhodospirillales bacterium]|nr:N-6 DNA methylase [Rhodospirillales bacterium]
MSDSIRDALKVYAKDVRETLRHMPPNPELALAPVFNALLKATLPHIGAAGAGLTVIAEYTTPKIGRPDLALKRSGTPVAAFIELKAPDKRIDPTKYKGHDKAQWERFCSLPTWALSNFREIVLYRRDHIEIDALPIVPKAALDIATSDTKAAKLIDGHSTDSFRAVFGSLAQAAPPQATNAEEVAVNLAFAARLVRDIIKARLGELSGTAAAGAPLIQVREEFREVLYAHPKAAGYPDRDFNELFAGAFAQTLAFGLLLIREATGKTVDEKAYGSMPAVHPLLRSTLRVLMQEEIVSDMGAGLDVMLGTVNSTDPALLAKPKVGHDPILYFYEDFLGVFDPEAKKRFGVFYTPVEVVRFQVGAVERVLREQMTTEGLLDKQVTVLDPATGTGTYLVACVAAAAVTAGGSGPGMIAPALLDLAERVYGFELLIGPYAVAHYRLHHEMAAVGVPLDHRLNLYLADTLAEPGAAAPLGKLGFIAQPMADERGAADQLKQSIPILAIIGNPPYRRLLVGETEELIGDWMAAKWEIFKKPVQDAGWGGELNTFPDLYIAFWRWALWKLFESPGATGRGIVCLITNRTFLAGHPYAGLRQAMRERFDKIEVFDLRGDLRRGARAGVEGDQGVFDIQAGTAITLAWATGKKEVTAPAEVVMHDAWTAGAFSRQQKLAWLQSGVTEGRLTGGVPIARGLLDDMRPAAFSGRDWMSLPDCFVFYSSGVQTKRDKFVYGFSRDEMMQRINLFREADEEAAKTMFHESRDRKIQPARAIAFDPKYFREVAYRPFDNRTLYNHRFYGDFLRTELQEVWGLGNVCFYAMPNGTGAGPAVWCHALLPDYHSFRGSYGGYGFPLYDRRPLGPPHNLRRSLISGLSKAYGVTVSPESIFDAMLCLLSARTYSALFAEDLEGAFPHVPFPRIASTFDEAATVGATIRELETFARAPASAFKVAKMQTTAKRPIHASGWSEKGFTLCADGSGLITGITNEVWNFSISGYEVLPRWLRHREGESIDFQTGNAVLDLCARIAELLDLIGKADAILTAAIAEPLTKTALNGAG